MTETEFYTWVDRATLLFDDVRKFLDSRKDRDGELLMEWRAVLSEIAAPDANAALDLIRNGEIDRGAYFDTGRFAGLVAREARAIASERRTVRTYGKEPSFRCHICRDSGLASVWNPRFVESYRQKFSEVSRVPQDRDKLREEAKRKNRSRVHFDLDKFDPDREIETWDYTPANWLHLASRWWKSLREDNGPIYHIARCHCDCERSRAMLREREDFVANKRTMSGRQLGMPACGMVDYNPRVMPIKTFESFDDLATWYATHEVNAAFEWQPDAAGYEQFAR